LWDRLRPWLHFWCGVPIAIAGVAGSFFVIAVNGWMNHPTGFTLVDGRATDVHPWRALFDNPMFWSEYTHMYFAAYIVCGFLLAGVYAWAMLRGRRGRYERTAFAITMTTAAVAAPLQVIVWRVVRSARAGRAGRLRCCQGLGCALGLRQLLRRLVAGTGLLVFANADWAHLVGVVCLVVGAIAVFRLAAPGGV
jgi:cytochrome bd ubiquinol oxidase subunit I